MKIDFTVETRVSESTRAKQLEAMFDVPRQERAKIVFQGDAPYEDRPWQVGLIVGPSGCGKSTLLRKLFGESEPLEWKGGGVIDDFDKSLTMQQISDGCQAVGFNTIPAWLRPYSVLSNGEKFRVELARRLLEARELMVMDEFTSVVDRRVAQIGSHAVQKYVRKNDRQFVAASCHYDIVDWLQPDWVLEPAVMAFHWRELQRRPALQCEIARVGYEAWQLFAPFHYLTADLHRAARCFVLFVEGMPAAFAGVLMMPHPKTKTIRRVSRLVTLPDFQGLGLAFALVDRLGAIYRSRNLQLRTYPAHPALVRAFDRSKVWEMKQKPGFTSMSNQLYGGTTGKMGSRPCAVFEYCGDPEADKSIGAKLLA